MILIVCRFIVCKRRALKMEKQKILISFGNRVKELRVKNGWSQEELARRSNFHRTYIGMIERAERNISLKNIERIANTFGIKINELFI